MIIDYIEQYKTMFGVEPICIALSSADVPIAPSTLYAARTRPPSARAVRDEELKPVIAQVHKENFLDVEDLDAAVDKLSAVAA